MKVRRSKIASLLLVSLSGLALFLDMGCWPLSWFFPSPNLVLEINQVQADQHNRGVPGTDHRVVPGRYERHPDGEGDIGVHHIDSQIAGDKYDLWNAQGFALGGAYVGSRGGPGFLQATRTGDVTPTSDSRGDGRPIPQTDRTPSRETYHVPGSSRK